MASEDSKRCELALNSDSALSILLIAEKYEHDKMKSMCQGFLENHLTAENCCSVYLAAVKSENKVWISEQLHVHGLFNDLDMTRYLILYQRFHVLS